jgi:CheY-like chemotaxis protein
VALHGGEVWAHSEGKDRGTELLVRLPQLRGLAVEPRRVAAPLARGGTRHRVLVVDNHRDAADTLAELLSRCGLEVRVAYEGAGACGLGATFEPHLVLFDPGMYGLDGLATARRMRQAPWGRAARLYALTGWASPSDREKTRAAGFDGHLVKPVELEELLALLPALRTPSGDSPLRASEASLSPRL